MSSSLKNHQRFISESECREIEALIGQVEKVVPLEVRVVFDTKYGKYPLGGMRALALLLLGAALICYFMWLPLTTWAFALLVGIIVFLPMNVLIKIPFAHFFASHPERVHSLVARAEKYFRESEMSNTTTRNGVLIYFGLAERRFFILPDHSLTARWPQEEWQNFAGDLQTQLRGGEESGVKKGVVDLLEKLKRAAVAHLGALPENSVRPNELSNGVIFL